MNREIVLLAIKGYKVVNSYLNDLGFPDEIPISNVRSKVYSELSDIIQVLSMPFVEVTISYIIRENGYDFGRQTYYQKLKQNELQPIKRRNIMLGE